MLFRSAGLNIGQGGGDPSSLADGDVWAEADKMPKTRVDGVSLSLAAIRSGASGSMPATLLVGQLYQQTS